MNYYLSRCVSNHIPLIYCSITSINVTQFHSITWVLFWFVNKHTFKDIVAHQHYYNIWPAIFIFCLYTICNCTDKSSYSIYGNHLRALCHYTLTIRIWCHQNDSVQYQNSSSHQRQKTNSYKLDV